MNDLPVSTGVVSVAVLVAPFDPGHAALLPMHTVPRCTLAPSIWMTCHATVCVVPLEPPSSRVSSIVVAVVPVRRALTYHRSSVPLSVSVVRSLRTTKLFATVTAEKAGALDSVVFPFENVLTPRCTLTPAANSATYQRTTVDESEEPTVTVSEVVGFPVASSQVARRAGCALELRDEHTTNDFVGSTAVPSVTLRDAEDIVTSPVCTSLKSAACARPPARANRTRRTPTTRVRDPRSVALTLFDSPRWRAARSRAHDDGTVLEEPSNVFPTTHDPDERRFFV